MAAAGSLFSRQGYFSSSSFPCRSFFSFGRSNAAAERKKDFLRPLSLSLPDFFCPGSKPYKWENGKGGEDQRMNNGGNSLSLPLPSSPKAILGVKFILSTSQLRISLSEMVKRSKERPMKGSLSLSSHSLARCGDTTYAKRRRRREKASL